MTNPRTLAEALRRERDRALLFRDLATLRTHLSLFDAVDDLQWRGRRRPSRISRPSQGSHNPDSVNRVEAKLARHLVHSAYRFKGKSLDGFCPMGPVVVTADEFGDPQAKQLRLRVNGATKQEAGTADMIFPVDAIIEWLSRGLTLEPGDIIATGTPQGVGLGRTPQELLLHGDVVETEVEGIGMLRNTVVDR